ncbi:MAG TPA: O-antigen ligase family protein [Xanthomonadaceae bacterium]|jgi:O-antigen ligase|nr:O-antigen ligase family protein [Xanthomonadaceae bacterium]
MPTSSPAPAETTASDRPLHTSWASWGVLACVALWPWMGLANAAMALGAVVTLVWLGLRRFRGGDVLLSREAWALTGVLFFSYWLPELFSCIGAVDASHALVEVLEGLRFLPFLWMAAIAVHREKDRRIVYAGIAIIALVWTVDGLVQAITGHSLAGAASVEPGTNAIRISGVFGAKHPHLGQVLATLAAFPLGLAARRAGVAGWIGAALLLGVAIMLAGSRAAWITFALALLFGGWRLLGWKRLLGVFAAGALAGVVLAAVFPRDLHDRIARTEAVFSGDMEGLDVASSGRVRIWGAALCMFREHPFNGVGVREYRDEYTICVPKMKTPAAWGEGGALHAHQIVLEVLSETGAIGLLLWAIGAAIALRAWSWAKPDARARAAMPAIALAVTVFPINTHLAFYSSFWGGLTLLLAGLYAGALFGEEAAPAAAASPTASA